ncbi:hypothetical protein L21_0947 [Methanoculleus chikugoensis]|jgi:hypothetical protein|uniref:Uncharacterized protein n=1 Tax=Methanoculleus chikugoensis TaxID=118126 RepID=A0A1M4MJR4_9EURY|nr:hypothetical protein [Methanoculleus chikugoensis]MDD4567578.1 hypothetical protein [Methanoculleus chikugoensis]SCL75058.1 hypothetical protein L21_0947 [Methanoculleus chikugoensis]
MYAGPCIRVVVLIAVLATTGCLGPADTAVNATPEPTPEPCETCTVPEDFCGPPGVCPGEPVDGVYVFTDRNVYRIGDVVEFGIVNCGDEQMEFSNPSPWRIDKWVTNASEGTPGNNIGTWEIIGDAGCTPCARCYLNPGQNWTLYRTSAQERATGDLKYSWTEERVRWNTTDWWDTAEASGSPVHPYEIRIHDDPLTPGKYRIWYGRNLTREFELV